jgi:hypothetical protein
MSNSSIVFVPEKWIKDINERFEEVITVYIKQLEQKFQCNEEMNKLPNLNEGFKHILQDLLDSSMEFCDRNQEYSSNNPPKQYIKEENSQLKWLLDYLDQQHISI